MMKRSGLIALVAAAAWIVASEFIRNELLFKSLWVNHYAGLNLTFQTRPLNGVLWMVWSLIAAVVLQQLLGRFSARRAVALTWIALFPAMWITLFNLQVLPLGLLVFAVPLSVIELAIATWIIRSLTAETKA
jgi:hypothetical protein